MKTKEELAAEVESLREEINVLKAILKEEGKLPTSLSDSFMSDSQRWKYAIENWTDGWWEWNLPLRKVIFSSQWKRMLGFEENEIGDSLDEWKERIHPEDLEGVMTQLNRYFEGKTNRYRCEHRIRCKNGSYKWILDEGTIVARDAHQQPIGMIGTHKDITQLKKSEFNLRERLKEINCRDRISMILNEEELTIEEAGAKIAASLPSGFQFPEQAEASVQIHDQFFNTSGFREGKKILSQEIIRNRHLIGRIAVAYPADQLPDAEEIFLSEERDLLLSTANKLANFIGKQEQTAALNQSRSRYQNLIENINDVIYEIDQQGIILYVSPSIKKVMGYRDSDLVGKHFLSVMGKSQEFLSKRFVQLPVKKEIHQEYKINTQNGEERWVRLSTRAKFQGDRFIGGLGTLIDITEKKVAELRLAQSEELYRNIVDNIQDVIYEISPRGIVLFVSPSIERILGFRPEEMIGTPFWQYVYEEDRPGVVEKFSRFEKKEFDYLEYRYRTRKGELRWARSSTNPVYENGQLVKGRGVLIDIHDRKLAEEQLHQLSQAVEQSPVSIVITNPKGEIEYANPKACETTGYTLNELKHQNPRILKSGEIGTEEYQRLWQTITDGKEWQGIFHNRKKNGELYWESATISPITNAEGEYTHFLAIKQDITEAKRIQEELQQSEERFRQIAEESHTVIWEVDQNGLYTYVSPLSEKVWGYSPEELIGKMTFYDLFPLEKREELKAEAMNCFARQESFRNFLNPIIRKDGSKILAHTNGSPIANSDGKLIGYRGADNDVTEQKAAEEALRQSEADLNYAQQIARMGSWQYDFRTSKVTWSSGMFRLLGLDPDEFNPSYQYLLDHVHPDDLKLFEQGHEEWILSGKAVSYDFRLRMADGQYRWLYNNIIPVYDAQRIVALKGINIDITEKKLDEEKIRQQNERLSAIIDAIPDLIFITDRKGTYLEFFNPQKHQMLYPMDQLIGVSVSEVFSPAIAQLHLQKIAECLDQQILITFDYSGQSENGEHYYEARLVPIGKDLVLKFVRDFTELRLRENEIKKLSLAIEQSPVITVITDLEGSIEYVNPIFESVTGYSFGEVVGKNINLLKSGLTERTVYEDLWRNLKEGKEWHGEWINRKKNGELYWEDVNIAPIHNQEGIVASYLAVKQDITERKRIEQEIREINASLEQRITERTAQLAETNSNLLDQIEIRRMAELNLEKMSTRLTVALRVAKVGVWDYDIVHDYLLWDKQMFAMYGITETGFDGRIQTWQKVLYPEDQKRCQTEFQRAIKGEQVYDTEFRVIWPDGSLHHIKAMASVQFADEGRPIHMIGANWDVTDQKRAADFEKELLQLAPKLTGVTRSEINAAIHLALTRIGQFLSADRAYIFEFDQNEDTMTNTFEWCNEGISPEIGNLENIPNTIFPQWISTLRRHENIIIPLVNVLPESWRAEREILEPQGIQSLIVMPLLVEQQLIGFVGLDSVATVREYNTTEINILKVWSSMLASLINNQRIETQLEQTRQNYETFFNTIDDFLWVFDKKSNILHTNQTAKTRLGYTVQELNGQPANIIHSSNRRTEVNIEIDKILKGDSDFCSIPLITKSGQQIPVETRIKPGFWNGTPVLFGVSKDMTQIQLSEQKFSRAFQTSPAMMAVSSFESGEYIDVNNAFLETFGYTRSEIIGKTNTELHILSDSQLREEIINQLDRGEEVRKMEISMLNKEGEMKTGLLSADSIYIGDTRCLLTVTLDITERIRVEEELKKARTEAEEANLAKSEFLSRMSHELRTPMNSILGFAQLLEMGELNPSQKKGVGHILKSGKHLLELINEVLDISRIEAGRLSFSLEPVQMSGILHETIDLVRPLALPHHIQINLDSDTPNELYIKADRQLLKQVLINLLNNAIKYNHSHGTVTVRIERHSAGSSANAMIRIAITDTGHGIPEVDLPKLFIPFERIGAEKTRIEGSGLGLSVAKKLTEAMGGKVGVESRIGEGSTFWIELPDSRSQLQQSSASLPLENGASLHSPKFGTILYIEDNASNIELAEQIIAAHRPGIRLICNTFGRQAVDLAVTHRPDLILLDLNLIDVHGSEVLVWLKNDPRTRTIPVVIISADAMPTQLNKLLKSGANKYLTKPLDISVLLKVIDEYIVG